MLIMWNLQRRKSLGPDEAKGVLVLSHGDLLINGKGVVAKLKPPLAGFSRQYSWKMLPVGIATIRVLVIGRMLANAALIDAGHIAVVRKRFGVPDAVMESIDAELSETHWYLGPDEPTTDDEDFSDDVPLVKDVIKLVEWSSTTLAQQCPVPAIAHDLRRLQALSVPQSSQYAATAPLG